MKVIVVGIGKTGLNLIEMLSKEGIDVTVIDCSKKIIDEVTDKYNVTPLLFASLLFTAICKASPDSHFAFLHFFFLGMVLIPVIVYWGFSDGSVVKNPPANAGDVGLIPGPGRDPEEGNYNSLQCSCLGNPMVRGAWWATVHGVSKSWTQLSN